MIALLCPGVLTTHCHHTMPEGGSTGRYDVLLRWVKDKQIFFIHFRHVYINNWRPVRLETFREGASPVHAPASIGLSPGDRLPVRGPDEVATREEFEAVATGLIRIKVERLCNVVLSGACLNEDVVIRHYVGGSQHVFPRIYPVRDMMQPTVIAGKVTRVGNIMDQGCDAEPGSFFYPTLFGL